MTTVTVYRSTDSSAPTLTGAAGSLLGVLDACLVNGYTGKSAAGWTKPYSNSGNKGCYKNSATDGTGFCLYIDDSGPGGGSYREARMTGFQTMTALGTGTGQFPSSSQLAIGIGAVVVRKSTTADSTVRAWTLIADDTVFYLFTETGDFVSPTQAFFVAFGDFFSYASSDPYRCMIMGRNSENTSSSTCEWPVQLNGVQNSSYQSVLSFVMPGHFMAAAPSGASTGQIFGKHTDIAKFGMSGISSYSGTTAIPSTNAAAAIGGGYAYNMTTPNLYDGGVWMAPIWLHHTGAVRGYLKGLWCPMQNVPMQHNDTFTGTGSMSSKSFVAQNIINNSNGNTLVGQAFIETSSTWS